MSSNPESEVEYDKPFKSYQEQIHEIKQKNILIEENLFTYEILESVSYYTLINGYKDLLIKSENADGQDVYKDGIQFENIYTLHIIDTNLNNILFKYILKIEKSLKTKIGYLVSFKYGYIQKDYLLFKNYSNTTSRRSSILTDLEKDIRNCRKGSPTEHYKNKKKNVPPWILVNDIFLYRIISWYSILYDADKEYIVSRMLRFNKTNDMILDKEFFVQSMWLLWNYRNSIAHGSRTFKSNISTSLPKVPLLKIVPLNVLNEEEFLVGLGKKDLYAVLMVIILLTNDKFIISNFINDLKFTLLNYSDKELYLNHTVFDVLGLPKDLFERLDVLINHKFK